jgi:hypothetical protein
MWDRCKERLLLGIYLLCRSAIHSPDAATDPQVSLRVCDHLAGLRDTLSVSGQCTSTDPRSPNQEAILRFTRLLHVQKLSVLFLISLSRLECHSCDPLLDHEEATSTRPNGCEGPGFHPCVSEDRYRGETCEYLISVLLME